MRSTRLTAAVCGIAALTLTGCASTQPGTPSTTSPAATTSSGPTVANPLDTTSLQKNLCGGFTPAQLQPYMGTVSDTKPDSDSKYTGCDWFPTDNNQANVGLALYPDLTPSDLIASQQNYPFHQQVPPIEGYPATHVNTGGDTSTACETTISVSDHVAVQVDASIVTNKAYKYYGNMCAVSDALTQALIGNLKAGG